jgi:hypothetical protein
MSQDLSNAKRNIGSVYPEKAIDSSPGLVRVEPILTAELFKTRFLKGLNLRSPITKEEFTLEDFKDYLHRAGSEVEMDTGTFITPIVHRQRHPFDPSCYNSWIYFDLPVKPIQKVLSIAVCSASYKDTPAENDTYPTGGEIYILPNEWIDMAQATRGVLNVNPLSPAFSALGATLVAPAASQGLFQVLGSIGWVPGYWNITTLVGWGTEDGKVPVIMNELIGTKAAILLLTNLIALYAVVSQSLNIDGTGQSVSNQMFQLLRMKRDLLVEEYDKYVAKVKTKVANNVMISNI